jgi:hypothetical protein
LTSPNADWSHAEDGDEDMGYDRFDKDVGALAVRSLDSLCREITDLDGDLLGLTPFDYGALGSLSEIDWLARLLVPPATTPLDNRVAFNEHMASLRQALPFTDAEREWLLDDPDHKHRQTESFMHPNDSQYIRVVRNSEAQLMSNGLYRMVRGRDLIQRWSSWRREKGEYADGAGLNQARESLRGIIELLVPDMGLPDSYLHLQGVNVLPRPDSPDLGA